MENFGKKRKMMMEEKIDDEALLLDNPVRYWLDRSRKAMLDKGMRVLRVPAAPPSLPPGAISHKKVVRLLCVDLSCDNCGTYMPRDMYVHAIDYCYPKGEKIGCYVTCSQCASDIVLGRDVDNRKFVRGATAHNPILIGHPWGVRLRTICVQSGGFIFPSPVNEHGYTSIGKSSVPSSDAQHNHLPGCGSSISSSDTEHSQVSSHWSSSSSCVAEDSPEQADFTDADSYFANAQPMEMEVE